MSSKDKHWGSRVGFLMAAVGSAVGLGNIWRFPAVAYENGGGAFFLPYLIALFTAGIPIIIIEFALGSKLRASAPRVFKRLHSKFEWLGWWQVGITLLIAVYYPVVIAWALAYTFFGINLAWGSDATSFFFNDFLHLADTPGAFGAPVPLIAFFLVVVWVVVLYTILNGVHKGIEKANKIFMPLLVILFGAVVVRGVTLPGAAAGLNAFFEPDWSKMMDPKVWVAAYGQNFFSSSICFAIMITYASYLPKKSEITTNAIITSLANSSFELMAGFGIFGALGFLATQQGVAVDEVVSAGVGLAFVVLPSIFYEMGALGGVFASLFFVSLLIAGLSSLVSLIEAFVSPVIEKFDVERKRVVSLVALPVAALSFLIATPGGLYLLDIIDHFVNDVGIVFAGLVEVILIAWLTKSVKEYREYANSVSDIQLGKWFDWSLSVITPVILGYMMVANLIREFRQPYEGYPTSVLLIYGLGSIVLLFVFSMVMPRFKNKIKLGKVKEQFHVDEEVEA